MSLRMAQGVTFVTGNARLARHFLWQADRQQAANDSGAWPSADILSWNAWLERLWRDSMIAGGAAGRVDLLTDHQSRLVWQTIVSESPSTQLAAAQDGPLAITMLMDAWRLAGSWDIPLELVRQHAVGPDSEAFARWAARYKAVCDERQWIDSVMIADLLAQDLETGRVTLAQPVAFAGFDPLTPQQARLQQSISALGLLRPPPVADAPQPRSDTVACLNQQHEFELAARWSRRLFDAHGVRLVGMLVPDGAARQARRIVLDVLAPDWRNQSSADLPVRLAGGRSLAEFGLIHIALLMLNLPKGVMHHRDLGQMLRSPYIEGGHEEGTQRAALDVYLRDQGLQHIDLHGLSAARSDQRGESPLAPGFRDVIRRALAWDAELTGRHEPGHWAGLITKLLQDLGWSKGRSLEVDEQRVTDAWTNLLDAFAACGPIIGSISFVQARRLLTDMAREQRSRPEGRMDGVQIMTVREAAGHSFDALWICGLSSDAWPPMPIANPLIPIFLQREHGVPEASPKAIRELADKSMRELLLSAPLIYASWPRRREEEELVASPALEALTLGDADSVDTHDDPAYREYIHAARQTETLNDDPAPPLQSAEKVRGGSQLLKFQSACPARAFFEVRLGVTELPVPPHGMDARTRGIIIHAAAAELYRQIKAHGSLAGASDEQIESWIDESTTLSLRRHFSRRHPLARTLGQNERRRMTRLLWELVTIDRKRDAFLPDVIEEPESIELGPLTLNLRQDRVDRTSDDCRLVIDYKTGRAFTYSVWRGTRPVEPQLPLYAAVAKADGLAMVLLNQDGASVAGVGRDELNIDGLQTPAKFTGDPNADWNDLLREWNANLLHLAQEFADGDCRINLLESSLAANEFAMLTRIHDPSVMYLIGAAE